VFLDFPCWLLIHCSTYCVYTVLRYSWWWTVDMSETCRVLYQINLRNCASRWLHYKNISRCTVLWMLNLTNKIAWHRVVWHKITDVSGYVNASVLCCQDVCSRFVRSVPDFLPDRTELHSGIFAVVITSFHTQNHWSSHFHRHQRRLHELSFLLVTLVQIFIQRHFAVPPPPPSFPR